MKKVLLVATCLMSTGVSAGESAHIVGGSLGYGTQDFESKNTNSVSVNAGDSVSTDLYYRYMLNHYFGVEAGFISGTGGVISAFTDSIFDVKDLSYQGIRGVVYGQYPLSQSNSFYAKVGASYHEVSYVMDKKNIETKDNGFYGALGWEYRFKSGVGINAEYQYIPMQELEVQSYNLGISYRF